MKNSKIKTSKESRSRIILSVAQPKKLWGKQGFIYCRTTICASHKGHVFLVGKCGLIGGILRTLTNVNALQ